MSISPPPPPTKLLTYEDYMAEEEINRRYDIIDGVRIFMASPTRRSLDILANTAMAFRAYERSSRRGEIYHAPLDILITRVPLRTRQPDILFISKERLALNPPPDDPAPLDPAPELVIEILPPGDIKQVLHVLMDKLRDYERAGVLECWVLHPRLCTVEVLQWHGSEWRKVTTYSAGESVVSVTFPDLSVSVDAIFAE